jgi:hypothetical protein
VADRKVPGAALALVQDGKAALAKAYGQRRIEDDLPVITATQFRPDTYDRRDKLPGREQKAVLAV